VAEAFLRIPRVRVGVLVGRNGKTKAEIQRDIGCKIEIDAEGAVDIRAADPLALMKAKNIVSAIGRGFSPDSARMLEDESYLLDTISIADVVGGEARTLKRYRARLIGRRGEFREKLEEMTGTKIAIFGKTVSIIGRKEEIFAARRAIEAILAGASHGSAFGAAKGKMKRSRKEELQRE